MNDVELLEQHRQRSGDQFFADLVRRHIGWVHGVARRRLRDPHLADDVAHAVFMILHRKAPRFSSDRALIAWLHRTAWNCSEVAARQRQRRQRHETEAAVQRQLSNDGSHDPQWEQLAPLLDSLIDSLGHREREAILLRFYRQMTFPEIATAMNSTEEAVRKRVSRALDKLRQRAASSGVTVSGAAIAGGLDLEAAHAAAPTGLTAATVGVALADSSSALAAFSAPIATGAMNMMMLAKLKIAASIALAVLLTAGAGVATVMASGPATRRAADKIVHLIVRWTPGQYPKLAPYTSVRFAESAVEAQIDGQWYDLLAINAIEMPKIVAFAQKTYGDLWQKRVAEDLVEVLSKMGHVPGEAVNLTVRDLLTNEIRELAQVSMTHENRQRVWDQRNASEYPKLAPYTAIRFNGDAVEAEIDGVWYGLLAINDAEMPKIVDFAKKTFGTIWQKRIAEDLVEVLSKMGHEPRDKVKLKVRDPRSNETLDLKDVRMTDENRQRVWQSRRSQQP